MLFLILVNSLSLQFRLRFCLFFVAGVPSASEGDVDIPASLQAVSRRPSPVGSSFGLIPRFLFQADVAHGAIAHGPFAAASELSTVLTREKLLQALEASVDASGSGTCAPCCREGSGAAAPKATTSSCLAYVLPDATNDTADEKRTLYLQDIKDRILLLTLSVLRKMEHRTSRCLLTESH